MKVKCNNCKELVSTDDLIYLYTEEYEIPVMIYECPACHGELNDLQSDIIEVE